MASIPFASVSWKRVHRVLPLVRAVSHPSFLKSHLMSHTAQRLTLGHNPVAARRLLHFSRAMADEEAAAKAAASLADTEGPTIFDKIIKREIPSDIVYEDDKVLAFRDINPQAPVHIVIIPKNRDGLTRLSKAESKHETILGQLLYTARVIAEQEGVSDGFRIVINNGPGACQSVYHLHLHLLGGRQMKWPPG